jgi:hypothetical protein
MNRLFPLPIYSFLKIVFENGGISLKRIKNLTPWFIKTILFEPLRWIELARENKKINEHTIAKDPVFILGFYRSGTSYLHDFLTQDDRLGYHSVFQMVFPEIMLTSEKWLSPVLQSLSHLFKIQDPVHRIPLEWKYPGEEDGTMTTSMNPRGAQWGYFFPKVMNKQFRKYVLFENISESELEEWKQDFVFLLKKISLANNNKQLVLKSPPNTARIKVLLSLFPNAKFIFIHRNPYEVYLSNKKFWKVTQSIYAIGGESSVDVNSVILDTYAKMMNRYLLEKDFVPEGQLVEIAYEDLIDKPLESIGRLYEQIHLDNFNYCENKMKSFLESEKAFVRLNHQMPIEETRVVTEKLQPFINHWKYPLL